MGRQRTNFKFNIPTSWDEITLETFIKLQSLYKDEHKPTFIEIISLLSNISEKELKEYPAVIIEKVIDNLTFLSEPITNDISNKIEINNEIYQINYLEELKFGEFVDVNTVLDADRSNFPAILSIICRKEGETYDDEYIAKYQQKRMDMFNRQPITKIYPLISFFLTLSTLLENNIQSFSENLKDQVNHILQHCINSEKNGTGLKRFMNSRLKKLTKLKKQLNSI